MEGREAYADWLLETKKVIAETTEWKNYVGELQDALDHHLAENHIPSFMDLAPSERLLFVDRVAKTTQSGASYEQLYGQVSHTLDQQTNNKVAKELLVDAKAIESTKTELLVDHLRDGAVNILKRWPEMKTKLHMCLNMPLPGKLRSVAWILFLSDLNVRKGYLDKLMKESKKAISKHDKLISDTCENILKIQNTFPDIGPPSVGSFFAMKAILSYFNAQSGTDAEPHHVYYLLTLPMLHVLSIYVSTTKPASNNVVAIMVEMYMTLVRDLPKYVADTKDVHRADRKTFVNKVAELLVNYDKVKGSELANYMAGLTADTQQESRPDIDRSVLVPMLSEVLLDVISPLIMSMFVGFLNKDTLLYVWDQYVIGLDVAGYHMHFLSAFTASLLILLKDDIMACQNTVELIATVQRESHKVNVRLVQAKMKAFYFKSLYVQLNQGEKAAVPVIDPTKVAEKAWTHWNNALIPERPGVAHKQAAREGRQEERDRLLRLRRDEELKAKAEFAEQQRLAEERLKELEEINRRQREDERSILQQQLEEEKKRREAKDRLYKDELNRLREEIEELKVSKGRPASSKSFISILAPPPSRASVAPNFDPFYSKQHAVDKQSEAGDILFELISTVSSKFNKLVHGDGQEADDLNKQTKEDTTAHEEDLKQAQEEVFGKQLEPGELERLPEEERNRKTQEVAERALERAESRYLRQALRTDS